MTELQILGLTRFAYPGLGGFQTEHDSVAARQAHLWAPARLEARLRSFGRVTLAGLRAQTDPGFRLLVVTGADLPEPWRGRLAGLVAGLPQAELVFHPPENPRDAMARLVADRVDPKGPPTMQFRMDDDDGVAVDFVERARAAFAGARGVFRREGRLCIDFNRGYMLRLDPPAVAPAVRAALGVAQAIVQRPQARRTALHYPHHRLPQLMPCLSLTDAPMWLRGLDGHNDSGAGARVALRPPDAAQRAELADRFALDPEAIAGGAA